MKSALVPLFIALSLAACKPQDPAPLPPEVNAPASAPVSAAPVSDGTSPAADTATADAAAPTASSETVAAVADGEAVYKKACITCHGAGIAGAPKLGDAADWGPRIAQGDALLLEHAIKGFTGQKGMMPAKGGFVTLSDDEVKAAIDYMVAATK
jgi:cytochrome c5